MAVQGEDVYASVSSGSRSLPSRPRARLRYAVDENISTVNLAWDEPEMLRQVSE